MSKDFTSQEIREACFSLNPNKAPGPDGFNGYFFRKAWSIIGEDVTRAIQEFFSSGKLLGEFNSTLIYLIPKVTNPSSFGDFRPISCCNFIYKIIAKLIAGRIKVLLPLIITKTQSAFIAGRKIGDNIMLIQEFFRDYHKDAGPPRCALKVDLQKAYDSLHWKFLVNTLEAFHFPQRVIQWIKACISSAKFSMQIGEW